MAALPPHTGDGALVIVPTLNERENIDRLIPAIFSELPEAHLLIVDDLSQDGTGERVAELAASDPRLHLSSRDGERGLGRAYIHGFHWALSREYRTILQMDADFSHQPRYLPHFLRAIQDADLVLGARYIPGGGVRGWGLHRQIISRGGNLYARWMLGLPFSDLTGGFKCFRREVLERIDMDGVQSIGYSFQIEMTWRAVRAGFTVRQIPILFPDRRAGRSKMSLQIFREAARNIVRMRNIP